MILASTLGMLRTHAPRSFVVQTISDCGGGEMGGGNVDGAVTIAGAIGTFGCDGVMIEGGRRGGSVFGLIV